MSHVNSAASVTGPQTFVKLGIKSSSKTLKARINMTNEITRRILSFDYFGQSFIMKLDQGITSLTTWSGLICTLLLLLIVGSYLGQKIDILLNNKDMDVREIYNDAYYNYTYRFDHLDFAVAFTSFDNDDRYWSISCL